MKRFALYIISVLCVILGIFFFLDVVYTSIYTYGIPRNKISHLLNIEKKDIDYVFIGSSRVENTIDTEIIEDITGKKALNLGIQEVRLNDSFMLLQLLYEQNIKPEIVFIQVDYIYNKDKSSGFLKSSLMPYIKDDRIGSMLKSREPNYYALRYIPFYRYLKYDYKSGFREVFNILTGNEPYINLESGYYPLYGNSGNNFRRHLPDTIAKKNKYLRAINKFAKEKNIKIAYFMSPFCSETKNLEYTKKLRKKIPSLIDYSTLFFEQDAGYFYDCDHLNNKGAEKFSEVFAEKINTLSATKGGNLEERMVK
ncbi:hypothetical protein RM553_09480 [Zunongwangia sp. F363]|uniref:SGNH/GDSL hydrolase family protein n=1 Tax=Autumnicola tepida TaxID=3075595 RepID=A0ABU3C9P7_9FLAO|nr:hypothetical protein [Zunongwangia sp. F363]MDT0643057.1 hypothetical protein [Zunongwangia sp. F363]